MGSSEKATSHVMGPEGASARQGKEAARRVAGVNVYGTVTGGSKHQPSCEYRIGTQLSTVTILNFP